MRSESCRHSEKEHPSEALHRKRDDQARHQPCIVDCGVQATCFFQVRRMRKKEKLKRRRSEFIKRRE